MSVSVKSGITGGTVSVNKTECWENDSIIITAKADEGYEIAKVLVNGAEIEKTGIVYKFTATVDTEVEVVFKAIGSDEGNGVGCGSSITAGGLSAMTLLASSAVVLFRRKRK